MKLKTAYVKLKTFFDQLLKCASLGTNMLFNGVSAVLKEMTFFLVGEERYQLSESNYFGQKVLQ